VLKIQDKWEIELLDINSFNDKQTTIDDFLKGSDTNVKD